MNRRGPYIAPIAVANRNARICWALFSKGQAHHPALARGTLHVVPIPRRGKKRRPVNFSRIAYGDSGLMMTYRSDQAPPKCSLAGLAFRGHV